eukprot:CAMPEP_0196760616 /NCGR_PEP_ID=MMETSP1091-20130531/105320_1 /TAXON_ID=302021 /ORGANISM="Rhodomonas sp., Strain CCMP768" /LENGTH=38 /DNA_ID= /DNA_START= /DNA_END= /DNA_ORIENTATION=
MMIQVANSSPHNHAWSEGLSPSQDERSRHKAESFFRAT